MYRGLKKPKKIIIIVISISGSGRPSRAHDLMRDLGNAENKLQGQKLGMEKAGPATYKRTTSRHAVSLVSIVMEVDQKIQNDGKCQC